MDTSNSWYHNVWDGLDIDILDNEVDAKFQYSMDYIKVKLDKIEKDQNAFINGLMSYESFIASLALFVLAVIQAVSCLTEVEGIKTATWISIGIAFAALAIRIGLDFKKRKINKKVGH